MRKITIQLDRIAQRQINNYVKDNKLIWESYIKPGENPDLEWDLLKHGECAWSDVAFENHLSPIWEELIAEHKADDYFVDDWNEHPELKHLA